MTSKFLSFPPLLATAISRLPALPPSFVFCRVMNLALRWTLASGDLIPLYDKSFSIRVTDTGLSVYFTVRSSGFMPTRVVSRPDLVMSATARDFYLLATRREDPDALFFSRRLVIEGDTELGLVAKNTLDAIELPALGDWMPTPSRVWAAARNTFFHP